MLEIKPVEAGIMVPPQLRILWRVRPGGHLGGTSRASSSFFRPVPIAARFGPPPRVASTITRQRQLAAKTGILLPQQRRGIATSSSPDLSYVEGPAEPPLLQQTIPEHFASIVAQHGDRPAVIARSPTPIRASLTSPAVPPTTTLTYAALDGLSNALARALRGGRLGVRKGDRVAASLANVAEHAVLAYAVFKLGAVLVPLNPGFTAPQLAAALRHLQARVLVVPAVADAAYRPGRGRSNLPLLEALIPGLGRETTDGAGAPTVEAPSVPSLRSVVVLDNRADHPDAVFPLENLRALIPFQQLLPSSLYPSSSSPTTPTPSHPSTAPITPDAPLSASETINIQFTSGTTSRPKAAMLTHAGILNNGRLIAQRMGLVAADRVVCPPPLFHCFGSVLGFMATATTGAALLLPSPAFDPAATLRMAAEHRATALYGVATMFVAELDLLLASSSDGDTTATFRGILEQIYRSPSSSGCNNDDQAVGLASHLRKGIAAGSSVPEALMRRLFDTLGLRDLVICYGMTETSPVSAMTAPADPFEKRTGTVGRAMPHTALKIVAPPDDDGDGRGRRTVVPRGERGELAVSGYLVMRGYWGDEAQTREVLVPDEDADGQSRVWMYTGDEACMDAEGYVAITGRIKDLIIRGGENVHPLEIENCLLQHPLVQDASVVGVPDARYGEVVGAFVVPAHGAVVVRDDGSLRKDGKDDVSGDDGSTKVLSKAALRDWVGGHLSGHLVPKYVFWLDEYPKTASGKIQKFKLREMAKELVAGPTRTGGAVP
ncbi:hypothetical protein SLS62_001354 [Diatrype stigma]|uniref:Uncharacterized protein n=1 Tax=Diatrype stigma TaxID=117547 RepID=A0AAN9UVV4_9PEZI